MIVPPSHLPAMPTRPPTPGAQLSTFLSRFPPETGGFAKGCLTRLRSALPGSYQIVYDYAHAVVVAFGATDRGYEAVVTLWVTPDEVRLYFDKSLPDPKGLLKGTGGKVRSVSVGAASDLGRGAIAALIKAAKAKSGATFRRGRPITIIIKSGAKQRKAKAGRA